MTKRRKPTVSDLELPAAVLATPEFKQWFEDLLQALLPQTRQIVATGEEHKPMLFIVSHDGQIAIQTVHPFDSIEDKERTVFLQRFLANKQEMIAGVVFVCEAWAATVDSYPTGSISQHPNRTEVIQFSAMRGGEQLIASYPIKRPGNILAEDEGKLIDPVDLGAEGRFVLNRNVRH
jgi:hypothetical protein